MAKIRNIEDLSDDEINRELRNGAKFVVFQYCIFILVMTFKKRTNIYFIKAGESTIKYSIGFTLITFFFGWWGILWGPIHSLGAFFTNLTGGKDVTQEVVNLFNSLRK